MLKTHKMFAHIESYDAATETWFTPDNVQEVAASELKSEMMALCAAKQHAVVSMLLGERNTPDQLERYKRKYARALNGDFTSEENATVIAAHEGFLTIVNGFVDMIEYGRQEVLEALTAGKLLQAKDMLVAITGLGKTTTPSILSELISASLAKSDDELTDLHYPYIAPVSHVEPEVDYGELEEIEEEQELLVATT